MKLFWMAVKSSRLGLSQQSRKRGAPPEKNLPSIGRNRWWCWGGATRSIGHSFEWTNLWSTRCINRVGVLAYPKHPLLTLETQMSPACYYDELQTGPALECTTWIKSWKAARLMRDQLRSEHFEWINQESCYPEGSINRSFQLFNLIESIFRSIIVFF